MYTGMVQKGTTRIAMKIKMVSTFHGDAAPGWNNGTIGWTI
jgi:hypothetical protein